MINSFASKVIPMILVTLAFIVPAQVAAEDISQAQLQQIMQSEQQVILLDVRTVEEFLTGHIPVTIQSARFQWEFK